MIEKFVPIQGYILVKLVKEEENNELLYLPKSQEESPLLKGTGINIIKDDQERLIKYLYFPRLVGYQVDSDHVVIQSSDVIGFEVE